MHVTVHSYSAHFCTCMAVLAHVCAHSCVPLSDCCRDRAEDTQGSYWCAPKWPSPKTLAIVLAVISLLVTAHSWGDQSYVTKGMLWMREHEQQGRVWFVVAYTACLLLLLPASVLALLAGTLSKMDRE